MITQLESRKNIISSFFSKSIISYLPDPVNSDPHIPIINQNFGPIFFVRYIHTWNISKTKQKSWVIIIPLGYATKKNWVVFKHFSMDFKHVFHSSHHHYNLTSNLKKLLSVRREERTERREGESYTYFYWKSTEEKTRLLCIWGSGRIKKEKRKPPKYEGFIFIFCSKMIFVDDHSRTLPVNSQRNTLWQTSKIWTARVRSLQAEKCKNLKFYDFCMFWSIENEPEQFRYFFVTECLSGSVLEWSATKIIFEPFFLRFVFWSFFLLLFLTPHLFATFSTTHPPSLSKMFILRYCF